MSWMLSLFIKLLAMLLDGLDAEAQRRRRSACCHVAFGDELENFLLAAGQLLILLRLLQRRTPQAGFPVVFEEPLRGSTGTEKRIAAC